MLPARWKDQARWISPEPLNVSPQLVGAPLALPARRALAMATDLLVVALLTGVSGLWLLGGLALVVLQLRSRGGQPGRMGKRAIVGWIGAALVVLLALQEAQSQWQAWRHPSPARNSKAVAAQTLGEVAGALNKAADEVDEDDPDRAASALRSAAAALSAQAAAAGAAAPADAASAVAAARSAAAADRLRIAQLEAELAAAKKPRRWRDQLSHFIDDTGAGLGWGIVYFSLLPAWWGGQTVGKKLFGLRVVELTGKPMTVMRSLKRYGGYAAGLATGGLGFLQILWEPNRQGLHDKAAHTAVIDLRAPWRSPPQEGPPPAA